MSIATTNSTEVHDNSGEDALRLAFVEMMFALAVAEVAIHAADLVNVDVAFVQKTPAIAHLSLTLLAIAASWVGWRQSVSPGMKDKVKFIFTWPFLGLLVDVLIVILYFMLARNMDAIVQNQKGTSIVPNAAPECILVCVIFGVYAFWDFVADMLQKGTLQRIKTYRDRLYATFVSCCCSLASLVLCIILTYLSWGKSESRAVVAVDLGLICVILLFRAIKPTEGAVAKVLRVEELCQFAQARETNGNEGKARKVMLAGYLLCAALTCFL